MTYSDDINNRLISMIDYLMARCREFDTVIDMSAVVIDSRKMYRVTIGDHMDGVEMFFDERDGHRWSYYWNGRENEVRL